MTTALPGYDALLVNGEIVHLRPFDPKRDAAALQALYDGMSARSIYLRWFTPGRASLRLDVRRMTSGEGFSAHGPPRRFAVVAERSAVMAGVAGWELLADPSTAEVAFVVGEDAHSLGLGTLLLELLAVEASRAGINTFTADVLSDNPHMVGVFRDAGYVIHSETHSGVVSLSFDIGGSADTRAAAASRESEASARSLASALSPSGIGIVGVNDTPNCVGTDVASRLIDAGYLGDIVLVGTATTCRGRRVWPSLLQAGLAVELVVVAGAAGDMTRHARDAAGAGARALLVASRPAGNVITAQVLRVCREHNMRLIGPGSMGMLNTSQRVQLDLRLGAIAEAGAVRGRVGFVGQDTAATGEVLALAGEAGIGFSTVVTLGAKADVSGNDLLSWWEHDTATDVCALQLESLGNPRKFRQITTRLGRTKQIVALANQDPRVNAFMRQSRITVADTAAELVAALLNAVDVATNLGVLRYGGEVTAAVSPAAIAAVQRLVAEAMRLRPLGGWLTGAETTTFAKLVPHLGHRPPLRLLLRATASGTFGPEVSVAIDAVSSSRVTPLSVADAGDLVRDSFGDQSRSQEVLAALSRQLLVLSELIEAAADIAEIAVPRTGKGPSGSLGVRLAPREQTMLHRQLRSAHLPSQPSAASDDEIAEILR